MFNKKSYLLNCNVCDTRKIKEEDYSGYEKMMINANVVVVSASSKSVLNRLPVTINQDSTIEIPDDIDVEIKKHYIAFKGRTNIVDIIVTKNKLKIDINMKKGTLEDLLNITEDISDIGHWGNGDYRVILNNPNDIDTLIPLIKQSLKVNRK